MIHKQVMNVYVFKYEDKKEKEITRGKYAQSYFSSFFQKNQIFHLQIFDGSEVGKNASVNVNHRKLSFLEYALASAKP